jgi:insertion element IS1 protein InsB
MAEVDEQWSYVQNKQEQRWLWYALDKISSKIIAYAFGKRTDDTFRLLLSRLRTFNVKLYFTDDWGSYGRLLPSDEHFIGKRYTQSIERRNLNLRTRIKRLARKTICFSKSSDIHDKVIGTYIEKFEYS